MREEGELLLRQIRGIVETDPWFIPCLSNISAVLMDSFADLNWAGFYLMREGRLVVGPFQGKVACVHIPIGKGVCGTCVEKDEVMVVPDVHQFPGHIACDSASNAEIVLPVHSGNRVIAVLDIDSPVKNRFSPEDREILEEIVRIIEAEVSWQETGGINSRMQ